MVSPQCEAGRSAGRHFGLGHPEALAPKDAWCERGVSFQSLCLMFSTPGKGNTLGSSSGINYNPGSGVFRQTGKDHDESTLGQEILSNHSRACWRINYFSITSTPTAPKH